MKLKILYKLRICDNNLHSKKIGGLLVLWDFGWVGQNSNKEPLFNFAIYLSKVPILLHVKIIVILPCVEDSIKIGHFYTVWTSRTWLRFNLPRCQTTFSLEFTGIQSRRRPNFFQPGQFARRKCCTS